MGSRHNKSNAAKVATEQAFIFEAKLAGHSVRAISTLASQHFGYYISKSTVQNRIDAEVNQTVQPLADDLRKVEVARLDKYLAALEPDIATGDPKAINAALRVSERRCKLLGIDAPVQVEVTHSVQSSVDAELEALAAELGLHDPTLPSAVTSTVIGETATIEETDRVIQVTT
jgi:hypothetical protein